MTKFGPLAVKPTGETRNGIPTYVLTQDFRAVDDIRGPVVVRAGYVTDYYSTPWGFGWLSKGLRPEPAVLHDWVCARGVTEITTKQARWATGIFNRAMKAVGVPLWKRVIMLCYVSLVTFGEFYVTGI